MDMPIRPTTRTPGLLDETLQRWGMGEQRDFPAFANSLSRLIDSEAHPPAGMAMLIRQIHERYHRFWPTCSRPSSGIVRRSVIVPPQRPRRHEP